ncbi:hypothetical protein AB0B63_19320 [Micromonospora sp. NPDC049081]|uniref:hypothetical protein n=1 Tax=Micromonospora sp. NPDC049081 TaxID=3155150 RepID=UPI0033D727A7
MAEGKPRRRTPLVRLGAPGPYVLFALLSTVLWFPVRLVEDPDRSVPLALVRAGLYGVGWGLIPILMAFLPGVRARADSGQVRAWNRLRAALRRGEVPADEADRAAVIGQLPTVRRGALIAVVGGVLLFGGLAVLAPTVDRTASGVFYVVVLTIVLALAGVTLGRVRRLDRRLADTR